MKFSHIVACANNNIIGAAGALPWHIPEDMKIFRRITTGHIVIMGRKTYESIGRPLAKRLCVVVSRQGGNFSDNIHHAKSLEDAFRFCKVFEGMWGHEAFIIGGGQIYEQSMPFIDRIYLSQIPLDVEGDVRYPTIDPNRFHQVSQEAFSGKIPFTFNILERRENCP